MAVSLWKSMLFGGIYEVANKATTKGASTASAAKAKAMILSTTEANAGPDGPLLRCNAAARGAAGRVTLL